MKECIPISCEAVAASVDDAATAMSELRKAADGAAAAFATLAPLDGPRRNTATKPHRPANAKQRRKNARQSRKANR